MENVVDDLGERISRWMETIGEGPLFKGLKQLFGFEEPAKEGGGVLLGGIKEMMPRTSFRETFSAMPSPEKTYPVEQTISKEPSVSERLSPETLASLRGLGEAIKTGKAPEGATFSKADTVAIANDFSVTEISAPAATPNPRFGQQQQTGMAMG
jgi:hypothetical protein